MKNTNKNIMKSAAAIVLMAAMFTINFTNIAFAASPGALDSTFDTDGKVTTTITGNGDVGDMAIQPDGKIVVVGLANLSSPAGSDFSVVRYNPDGSLDTTFNADGKVTTDFGAFDNAKGVAIQYDGKIIVVGFSGPTGGTADDFAIARYTILGSLDTSFDTDGKVLTDVANFIDDNANSVAIQPDGKIVVGGTVGADFGLVRYNLNGSLDTTFDTDGKRTVDFGGTDEGEAVALQADGKIVIAGERSGDFAVAKLNTNGSLDTLFDTDGMLTTDINGGGDGASSVAIQTDGKIVVGGGADSPTNCALVRYNINGTLDTTFDGDGKVITNFNTAGSDRIQDISIQANGKIVAGFFANAPLRAMNALRYNPNGSLDTTFGTGGSVSVPVQAAGEIVRAMAMSGDGKIVIAGVNAGIYSLVSLNTNIQPTATGDFDGDGFSDSTVYRPASGTWFTLRSIDQTVTQENFGLPGDVPVDGDFDGDSRADLCIFRPSNGVWFFKRSSNGSTLGATFGQNGDKPVVGDYDKDGKSDIAIWRPSDGNFFILRSSSNFSSFFSYPFGQNGDIPIQGGAQ